MKSKRSFKNYIIPIVLTITFLIVFVSATNLIANNKVESQRLNISNISLDSSGNLTFYDGSTYRGVSSGTADVVVCRGTNAYDDLYKSVKWVSGCDVVCKSTDSNCADEWQTAFDNGGIIVSSPVNATYPINITTSSCASKNYALKIGKSNTYVYGNGAIFIMQGTRKVADNTLGICINANDVGVQDIFMTNGSLSGTVVGDMGIMIFEGNNINLYHINVQNIEGHQVFIMANTKNVSNVNIFKSYFNSPSTSTSGDVIGGISNQASVTGFNINIKDNYVAQNNIAYTNAIDLVGGNSVTYDNNEVIGQLVFGSETRATINSEMINNKIYPIGNIPAGIIDGRTDNLGNSFINNKIIHGNMDISGNYEILSQNTLYNGSLLIKGNYNTIDSNPLINLLSPSAVISVTGDSNTFNNNYVLNGRYSVQLTGANDNQFTNNVFDNASLGSNPQSITSDGNNLRNRFLNNKLINNNIQQYAIFMNSGDVGSEFNSNTIYNYGSYSGNLAYVLNSGAINSTFISNNLYGNKTSLTKYFLGTQGNNYIDDFTYSGSLTANQNCTLLTNFNDRTSHNSTTSCTCTGGAWKCWEMS